MMTTLRSYPASIFPLRFSRQMHDFPSLGARLHAEFVGVVPRYRVDGIRRSNEIAGIASHNLLVLLLSHLKFSHIERLGQCNGVRRSLRDICRTGPLCPSLFIFMPSLFRPMPPRIAI